MEPDDIQWVRQTLGEDIAEMLEKRALDASRIASNLLADLRRQLGKAKTWYGENKTLGNVIGGGVAGAGISGGLTMLSKKRPGEDALERTSRVLRNSALGGLMGGGAGYAIPEGIKFLSAPAPKTRRSMQVLRDKERIMKAGPITAAAGAGAGGFLGWRNAANSNARTVANSVTNSRRPMRQAIPLALQQATRSRGLSALGGSSIGALVGLSPQILSWFADKPVEMLGDAARGIKPLSERMGDKAVQLGDKAVQLGDKAKVIGADMLEDAKTVGEDAMEGASRLRIDSGPVLE